MLVYWVNVTGNAGCEINRRIEFDRGTTGLSNSDCHTLSFPFVQRGNLAQTAFEQRVNGPRRSHTAHGHVAGVPFARAGDDGRSLDQPVAIDGLSSLDSSTADAPACGEHEIFIACQSSGSITSKEAAVGRRNPLKVANGCCDRLSEGSDSHACERPVQSPHESRPTKEVKRVQHHGSGGKMAPCLLFPSQILSDLLGLRQAGLKGLRNALGSSPWGVKVCST